MVGQLGAPRKEVPVWDQLGSPRVYLRERTPSTTEEGTDWGTGRRAVGSAHCTHRQRGAFRVCSVLRGSRRWSPLLLQHLARSQPGPWAHTVSPRPPGPHRVPPLFLPSHFQRLKMSFLRTRKKKIKRRQRNRAAFTEDGRGRRQRETRGMES